MTVQLFLHGKFQGIEDFLLAPAASAPGPATDETVLAGRSQWVTLLAEVLPRALLAELGLAKFLLGFAGGGQFLVILPAESREAAEAFLGAAAAQIQELSGGRLRLVWALTENLGPWSIVSKRLADGLWQERELGAPAPAPELFEPYEALSPPAAPQSYFTDYLAPRVRTAKTAGWSPESPGKVLIEEGKHQWGLASGEDAIPMARHAAPQDETGPAATTSDLAAVAEGQPLWGILRGDVDNFGLLLRRQNTVEDHVQISVMFKQFFAGELEVLCSMAEFWRKTTILYTGDDDFAVYGSWDALIGLARELQRLFHRFCEANLGDQPGPEGKTISMALTLATDPTATFRYVWEEAGRNLNVAKSTAKDCIHVFGRTLEWKQFNQASELKDNMLRMVREYRCSPQFLAELSGFYHDRFPIRVEGQPRFDRPWRYHRRFYVAVGSSRDREFLKLRTNLVADLIGRSPTQVRLRPAGRVAVEWARLLIEVSHD
jgi:CRISPR-associated protein Csm1